MKVAIITNTTYEAIIPLAKALSSLIEVELFTILSKKGSGKSILYEKNDLWDKENVSLVFDVKNKGYINDLFTKYIGNKYRIHAIYLKSLAYIHPANWIVYYHLVIYLRKKKFDIIHFNIENPLLFLIKYFVTSNIVVTIHDPIPHTGEDDFQRKILRWYLNSDLKIKYIFHSYFSLKQFNKFFPKTSRCYKQVIPFGPHEFLNLFKSSTIRAIKGRVLFFGRISPYKGIDYLIDGFRAAKEKVPFLSLMIAGNGKIEKPEAYTTKDLIIINRYIDNEYLSTLIQKSELIVCPYIDATQSGVVETAFTFLRPVLATKVGAMDEKIQHLYNGYLIDPMSSEQICEALIDIFQNNLIEKMNYNLSQELKSAAWQYISNLTYRFYVESINSR